MFVVVVVFAVAVTVVVVVVRKMTWNHKNRNLFKATGKQ
jgi:hypothetical protein